MGICPTMAIFYNFWLGCAVKIGKEWKRPSPLTLKGKIPISNRCLFLRHPIFAATCGCWSKPESIIIIIIITGWRLNGETAASHYTTSGLVVVVETCAALLLHTNVFAALKAYTNSFSATDIWTFLVTEVILWCFPQLSCKNSGKSMLRDAIRTKKPGNLGNLSKQVAWVFQIPLFLKNLPSDFWPTKIPPIIVIFLGKNQKCF